MAKQSAFDSFFGTKTKSVLTAVDEDNDNGQDKNNASGSSEGKKPKLTRRTFRESWLRTYTWLRYADTIGMTCDCCIRAGKSNPLTCGCLNFQNSTLTRHMASKDHTEAVKILEMQVQFRTVAANAVDVDETQQSARTDGHVKQLRTVYMMARRNCPADLFADLMALQVENGVTNCDEFYKKPEVIDEMEQCIFEVLETSQVDNINKSPFIGVMLDETCDINVEKKLAIYIRYIDTDTGKVIVCFAGNEHITDCTSNGILDSLLQFLHRKGIVCDDNSNIGKILGLGTDGAPVMTGRLNGLGVGLKRLVPELCSVHCAAHRLNLAASQAGKDIPYLTDYHRHIGILYRYYKDSSVKYDRLRELQDVLHGHRYQVHEPTSVRWLSVEAAVKMILQTFDSLVMSLESVDAAKDPKAVGLHNFMGSTLFLLVTALLVDVLVVIGILSRTFQKDSVNLADLRSSVDTTLGTLQTMKLGSHNVDNVLQELGQAPPPGEKTTFKNVDLVDNGPMRTRFSSIRDNYINSLSRKLKDRFPQNDLNLLECLDIVLNPCRYPQSHQDLLRHGDEQLKFLLGHYKNHVQRDRALNHFLMFKHHAWAFRNVLKLEQFCCNLNREKKDTYPDFVILAQIASIIPVSSAPYERGFSVQNAIKTHSRNRLNPGRVNRLMFIRLEGPVVGEFQYDRAVRLFQRKQRRK